MIGCSLHFNILSLTVYLGMIAIEHTLKKWDREDIDSHSHRASLTDSHCAEKSLFISSTNLKRCNETFSVLDSDDNEGDKHKSPDSLRQQSPNHESTEENDNCDNFSSTDSDVITKLYSIAMNTPSTNNNNNNHNDIDIDYDEHVLQEIYNENINLELNEQELVEIVKDEEIEEIKSNVETNRAISAPFDYRAKQILLINVKHKCIAEQLTLIYQSVYKNIPFDKVDKQNHYTMEYTKLFNQTVRWVQYSILVAIDSKQRAKIIKKWIKVCTYLLALRNFHGLVAVHCALKSNSVYSGKLKIAWFKYKKIIKKKHHHKLQQIAAIVSYKDNFNTLRDKTSNAETPALPYWGIFKRDCQFAAEFDNENGQNMVKALLQTYHGYKNGQYVNLQSDVVIKTWIEYQLMETSLLTMQAMNRMSDNVRNLDEQQIIEQKRRYSITSIMGK